MTPVATRRLKYLQGYCGDTVAQVEQLLLANRLGGWLQNKYPAAPGVRADDGAGNEPGDELRDDRAVLPLLGARVVVAEPPRVLVVAPLWDTGRFEASTVSTHA